MTAATGKTYHFAPLVAAAAPGFLLRATGQRAGAAAALAAVSTAAVAWAVIAVAGIEPPWTLWSGQPGGVRLEVAASTAVGVAVGAGRGPLWSARAVAGAVQRPRIRPTK